MFQTLQSAWQHRSRRGSPVQRVYYGNFFFLIGQPRFPDWRALEHKVEGSSPATVAGTGRDKSVIRRPLLSCHNVAMV